MSRIVCFVTVAMVAWAALPAVSTAEGLPTGCRPHVEPCKGGRVDWTAGFILAEGKGIAEGRDDQSELMAKRAAFLDAAANALAISLGIPVDAKGRAGDVKNGRVKLEGVIKGHEIVEERWLPEEKPPQARVSLRVPLWGVKGVASVFVDRRKGVGPRLVLASEPVDVSESVLIVDARGVGLKACLYPVVADVKGAVLHDAARIEAAHAGTVPAVRYAESTLRYEQLASDNATTARLASFQEAGAPASGPASHPTSQPRRRRVVVKATAAAGELNTQIVLTQEDAEKLRQSAEGAAMLRAGQVVVVVDSAAAGIEGRRRSEDSEAVATALRGDVGNAETQRSQRE